MTTEEEIVKRGRFLYAKSKWFAIRIVRRPEWYGISVSGEPELREDTAAFYVEFGTEDSDGAFTLRSGSLGHLRLEAAIQEAEASAGPSIEWLE